MTGAANTSMTNIWMTWATRLLSAALAWLPLTSPAQPYPNKPIRFIVPYPAGGGTDIIARMLGAKLTEAWGQQVVVENRAGASGILGNDLVAKAAPDGYTVLIGITTLVQMPHLNPKLPYDVFKDFTPVAQLALSSNLFAVPANSPANSLKEFIALPEVQTFAEQGLKDFEPQGWFGMLLPGNAPREITAKLGSEIARILKLPEVQARINDIGLQTADTSPDQFAAAMKNDYAVWGRVVREAQIKVD